MKEAGDTRTGDLLGPVKRPRGRPALEGSKTAAERQRDRRERLKDAGSSSLTVTLPQDVLDALDKFVQFKDMTKSQAVERILRDRFRPR